MLPIKTRSGLLIGLLVFQMVCQGLYASANPVGEVARYIVDTNPNRTSSLIKNGSFKAQIGKFLSESNPPSYEVTLNYIFNVKFLGEQTGIETSQIDESYFSDEFMAQLRVNEHYESLQFKIDHLGYADKTNLDGHSYPHCDKVRIYDVQSGLLLQFAKSIFASDGEIEDLVVVAHIFKSIPVLGGAQLDMSGVYKGMNVKAGGDYLTP